MTLKPCCTPDEVAGLLRVDTRTVQALIAAGRLHAVRVGDEVRIPRQALDAFLGTSFRPGGWRRHAAFVAVLAGLGLGSSVRADIPAPATASSAVAYAGFLESNGVPVNGTASVRAAVFDAATGGTPVYAEQHDTVPVAAGQFQLLLGTGTTTAGSYESAWATAHGELFLALEVKGPGAADFVALDGRQRLATAPYAHRGAPGRDFLVDRTLVATRAADVGYLSVAPQDAAAEGGELQLRGSGGNNAVYVDNLSGNFRVHDGTNVRMETSGANLSVPAGNLTVSGTVAAGTLKGPLGQTSCYWKDVETCGHGCGNGVYYETFCDPGDYMVGMGHHTWSQYTYYNFRIRCCRP